MVAGPACDRVSRKNTPENAGDFTEKFIAFFQTVTHIIFTESDEVKIHKTPVILLGLFLPAVQCVLSNMKEMMQRDQTCQCIVGNEFSIFRRFAAFRLVFIVHIQGSPFF